MLTIRRLLETHHLWSRSYRSAGRRRGMPAGKRLDSRIQEEFGELTEEQKMNFLETAENVEQLQEEIKSTTAYRLHKEEALKLQKKSQEWLKNKIITKKHFPEPKEINLLLYDTKEQIRFLHAEDPMAWTPEILSKSFPISVEGVKKLLKSKCKFRTVEEIQRHDQRVLQNWKDLNPEMAKKIMSRYLPKEQKQELKRSAVEQMAGVKLHLPAPVRRLNEEEEEDRIPGKFESIVTKHLELLELNSGKNSRRPNEKYERKKRVGILLNPPRNG